MIAPRYRFFLPPAALLVLFAGRSPAQVRFEVRGESGVAGEAIAAGINQDVKAALYIKNAGGPVVQGFQMAVTYDPAFLDFTTGTWKGTGLDTAALSNNNGPFSYNFHEVPGGGITLGVVFE